MIPKDSLDQKGVDDETGYNLVLEYKFTISFSFFPKSLFLLLVLYLSYLFRILKIPNLNDTWLG